MKVQFRKSIPALVTAILLFQTQAQAQNFKQQINDALDNYLLPIIIATIMIGVAAGIVTNFEDIYDKNGLGTRKKGLISAGMIMFYVIVAVAILGAAVAAVANLKLH